MADEQLDQSASADYQPPAPPDPTQPASSSPEAPPTADQPAAEPTDAGSSAPPFEEHPQAPIPPNPTTPGATSSEAGAISKVDPPQHSEPGTVKADSTVVQPIHVDQRTRRSDEDALEGHFVDLVAGEHEGRRGTFDRVTKYGSDGYPARILVITRDARNEYLDVPYSDARPTVYRGGR